jgi:hypothetical protein
MRTRGCLLVLATLLAAIPAGFDTSASAEANKTLEALAAVPMRLGYQSDAQLLNPATRKQTLEFMGDARCKRVRLMLQENKLPHRAPIPQDWVSGPAKQYLDAVQAAYKECGSVMLTMFRWQGLRKLERPPPTPAEMVSFARNWVPFFAPWVNAWSPNNEPNHPSFWLAVKKTCYIDHVKGGVADYVVKHGKRRIIRYKRVHPGHGQYRRIVRWIKSSKNGTHRFVHGRHGHRDRWVRSKHHATHWRKVTYKRAHGRKARFKRIVRWVSVSRKVPVATKYDLRVCQQQSQMDAYRYEFDGVTKVIRQTYVDMGLPQPLIVAGELAPGKNFGLLDYFWNARQWPPDADVIGLHSYAPPRIAPDRRRTDIGGVEHAVEWGRARGVKIWLTESGFHYPSNSQYWPQMLERAKGMWDSGLRGPDPECVARTAWGALMEWLRRQSL